MSQVNMDLPALSADESAQSSGNMTDTSVNEHRHLSVQHLKSLTQPLLPNSLKLQQQLQQQQMLQQQQHQHQQIPAFMDQSFFYDLDQLARDNPLFFMQTTSDDKNAAGPSSDNREPMHASSTTLARQSISNSMESFQTAVSTSVGEQPPSFWTGLNNFISNVTHNNIFPTFPNIARSFQEYLANHPVPFLSSFNASTASPVSSPMPSSMDFEPMVQFKKSSERSDTGLQIRVLGVPQTGAKSRVETQIKLCIQLVTDGGDKAQWWSHLKLPEHMVTKDKLKKFSNNSNINVNGLPIDPEKALYLQAKVLCASDPTKKVVTCLGCIQREQKRSQRRKENKQKDEAEDEKTQDEQSLAFDKERILLFNCSDVVDFNAGDTILPTRITCYCRHHNERLGFCIYFEMLDHTGKKVAEGISPPIMITDDHKSNKVKAGSKRRRTESEVSPEPRIPAPSWIKSSLPFGADGNNIKTEPIHTSMTSLSSTTGASFSSASYPSIQNNFTIPSSPSAASEMEDMKPALKSMLSSTVRQQQHQHQHQHQHQQQQQQYLYSFNNNDNNINSQPQPQSQQQQQQQQQQQPSMKRLIPNEAPKSGGIEITILGTDFRPGMTVMFGDTPVSNMQCWSPNTLICTLPPATQPGAVVVSIKEAPLTDKSEVMVFTYIAETDRALMELALQVVGMKMTGIVEDARKIAMRIVQGNNDNSNQ